MKKAHGEETAVALPRMSIAQFTIVLIGTSELICHRFGEKTKTQLKERDENKAQGARKARKPKEEYLDSMYPMPGGGYGFPCSAFKRAAVDSCSFIKGVTKVEARGAFHVLGDLTKINGKPYMREDTVRIGRGAPQQRYRGAFKTWSVTLTISHNKDVLSAEQIANLYNNAGFAVGVGEWRPQKNGSMGMFRVANEKD